MLATAIQVSLLRAQPIESVNRSYSISRVPVVACLIRAVACHRAINKTHVEVDDLQQTFGRLLELKSQIQQTC